MTFFDYFEKLLIFLLRNGGHAAIYLMSNEGTMSEPTNRQLIDAINHNADLLEKHLSEGVYVHKQASPSTTWSVTHSLGSLRPLIETYDSGGNKIGHGVNRQSQTLAYCEIVFVVPVSGTAILRF